MNDEGMKINTIIRSRKEMSIIIGGCKRKLQSQYMYRL